MFLKLIVIVFDQCLKYKTDQAQEAKKMEKLNNIFFTLMARGPEGMSFLLFFVDRYTFGHLFADGYICMRNDFEIVFL